jgi:hypothetical protein
LSFSYLDETTVFDAFKDSEKYMRPLFEPFNEYERISRNKPHPGIDKAYPKVTDGTTSSVIEKTPRRILQQIPTGLVISDQNDWLTLVANFKLAHQIIPNANDQFPFLQKCQMAISKALTYGSQPAYVYFTQHGKTFGPDMRLPYIKDVFLEPGKVSDTDSNFIMMRAWYQKRDLEAIIARENKLSSSAEKRGETYESGWNIQALQEIKDSVSQKDDLATTPNEKDKNNRNGGIEIIHCFQRGIGAKFYSIHMKTKQIVRTRTNKDPRGELPIHYLYATADVSNPLGRGFVEMVGSMQNLMDSEVQMYQYNRALMLNPPMTKRGNWNKNQAKLAPNILVDLGSDANSAWEPVKIDSTALQSFSQNYSLMQSQMYQLLSAPTSNISASVGNTQMSKTPQGVKQADNNLNVDDTFIRNQGEAWLTKVFATMLNLDFAERSGTEELQLDTDTASDIRNLTSYQEGQVSEDDKIRINYDSETEALDFKVDAGSSEQKDDADEIAQLKEIIADVNANPYSIQYIQQAGKTLNLGEVYKQLFGKLGLKELDKIMTDVPTGPDGQKQTTPPMAMDKPKLTINYDSITSPTIKAALLQNAGIQADAQDIAQSDQAKAQMEAQAKAPAAPDTSGIENHPVIKLMSSLNIKFTDLPEDSKQEVLQIIGIPTEMNSPVQNDQAMKAMTLAHTIATGTEQQANQQQQMQQTSDQNQAQNELAAQSQQQESSVPAASQQQEQPMNPADSLTPEDQQYLQELLKMGLSEQQAGQALALIHHGYPIEDVIKMIGVRA